MAVQRLTVAYRSRPRPSSTPGAKASTVCPYYLDGDQAVRSVTVPTDRICPASLLASVCGFQGPARSASPDSRGPVSQNSAARSRARGPASSGSVDVLGAAPATRTIGRRLLEELPRKEVIQPHLPVRLPCYDFTPITSPTFDGSLPLRGWATGFGCCPLSWCDGRCVQGPGTYSPRRC